MTDEEALRMPKRRHWVFVRFQNQIIKEQERAMKGRR